VKTRLSPPLSLEQSARFYREMLADVLDASLQFARRLDLEPVLAFHPPDAANEILAFVPAGFRLQPQRGANLGERMANAFAEAAAAGASRIVLRGSDSPAVEGAIFEEAILFLDEGADIALSPDQGGGYAVVGMRVPHPKIFDLPMSTDRVLDQTIAFAEGKGLEVRKTRAVFDLDTVNDFREFEALDDAVRLDLCPRTVEAISVLRSDGVL
jgi:glycosyltransferase A (GT-A) superfamily protein (DUF2064 family)